MTCPFCKEDVKDGALRCRYCQSALVPGMSVPPPLEAKPSTEGKVTYVVDEGLLRFGKFVVAVLGTFIVVGTYLFGIKLELTVEKMRTAQTALEASTKALKDREAAAAVASKQLENAESRAEALLKEIEYNRTTSVTLVAEMQVRYLQPSEQARLNNIRSASPEKFRTDPATTKLWPNGTTLHVWFMDGTPEEKENFRIAFDEWLRYANLRVAYRPSATAEVHVSFAQSGSWAMVGTDSVGLRGQNSPTINLGFAQTGSVPPRNYLHEIGHLLGLIHEFKNPSANLKWDKSRVYEELGGPPNYWTKEQVDFNLFTRDSYPGRRVSTTLRHMLMEFSEFFHVSWTGLLIHASVGTAGGLGAFRTKRSG
jgi:exonuclease VII small subunit